MENFYPVNISIQIWEKTGVQLIGRIKRVQGFKVSSTLHQIKPRSISPARPVEQMSLPDALLFHWARKLPFALSVSLFPISNRKTMPVQLPRALSLMKGFLLYYLMRCCLGTISNILYPKVQLWTLDFGLFYTNTTNPTNSINSIGRRLVASLH